MESIDCLNKESIILLHKNNLLRPLIKSVIVKNILSKVDVANDLKEKLINNFMKKVGINEKNSLENWLKINCLSQTDLENITLKEARQKLYCQENFKHKVEARFLERKNKLDIVVYSLIRIKNFYKAKEIYLRISDENADFGDLAAQYSEGIENKSRGIVGPVPMEQAHPKLVGLLKIIKKGETHPPIKIKDSYVVVRLESYEPAQLNNFIREKMGEELFNIMVDEQVNDLSKNLLSKNLN